jgi:hypothetical protein
LRRPFSLHCLQALTGPEKPLENNLRVKENNLLQKNIYMRPGFNPHHCKNRIYIRYACVCIKNLWKNTQETGALLLPPGGETRRQVAEM